MQHFTRARQFPHETLVDYKTRYQESVAQLNLLLGAGKEFTAVQTTMNFMMTLDRGRYGRFLEELKRWEDNGAVASVPQTLVEAVTKCKLICTSQGLGASRLYCITFSFCISFCFYSGSRRGRRGAGRRRAVVRR
jgi:hypothetical protein